MLNIYVKTTWNNLMSNSAKILKNSPMTFGIFKSFLQGHIHEPTSIGGQGREGEGKEQVEGKRAEEEKGRVGGQRAGKGKDGWRRGSRSVGDGKEGGKETEERRELSRPTFSAVPTPNYKLQLCV
jgi:hypothetical protein